MRKYDHKKIEKKWREEWAKSGIYRTEENTKKPKSYVLDMFPYPSGEGLHVGHPKGYIATDVYSRMKKMQGHEILHPMGWDAFGLPAENFALKSKIHPRVAVEKNIARFKEQLSVLGFNYDWSREINTTDPAYYKWTQWIFLQLFKKGLAYESDEPINWCPSCKTGLANEDLEGNVCERCGTPVEQRKMRQWVLRITDYAERLLEDISELEKWPEHIKEMQRNWIGRSAGAEITFRLRAAAAQSDAEQTQKNAEKIKVFTTRPDTLFGATYMVLAPEHELVEKLKEKIENRAEVEKYQKQSAQKTEIERTTEGKEKTGVELKGVKAVNPANNEEIPVYIADYVLAHYGTGAIMAVPSHDSRDWAFAEKFALPRREVVVPTLSNFQFPISNFQTNSKSQIQNSKREVYEGAGVLVNSGKFDGLTSEEAKEKITKFVKGKKDTTYKLRDWVFSRQRYWGEPIPLIFCEACKKSAQKLAEQTRNDAEKREIMRNAGWIPVPEEDLPVELPDVKSYEPTGTGESPLAQMTDWVNTTCPSCGAPAKRETNTMPQWAGSSWYYLRYCDPHNDNELASKERLEYWMGGAGVPRRGEAALGVDMYVGGAEHATRHLIYARFWHKFLFDLGVVSTKEPFAALHSVGLIQAEDGRKMSKRYGNVINPDDIVKTHGADTLRVYEMFMGPFEQAISWNDSNLMGARRFLERVWRITTGKFLEAPDKETDRILHNMIQKVTNDIAAFKFNTAIAAAMTFINRAEKAGITREQCEKFVLCLAPFAPHLAEEIWREVLGNSESVHTHAWPSYDKKKLSAETVTIAVQVNGKVRAEVEVATGAVESDVRAQALGNRAVQKWLGSEEPKKIIFVPDRLINFVV